MSTVQKMIAIGCLGFAAGLVVLGASMLLDAFDAACARHVGTGVGRLSMRQVRKALRKRYGAKGYRILDSGSIEVDVTTAGQRWWGPYGNLLDGHTHRALAGILAE